MKLPLRGVRVLDLSRLLPGPYATLLLSDLGAEVIRVEDPEHPDWLRDMPPLASDGLGLAFHTLNRGKKSVAMRYIGGTERQRLLELVQTADVLVESFRPGVLENLGLAPEVLWKAQPRLILCRISGFGQSGPDRNRAGHDLNFVARTGLLDLSAQPQLPPVPIADLVGGAWPAALQICAHLHRQQERKTGVLLDINMLLNTYANLVLARSFVGQGAQLGGGRGPLTGGLPSYGIYATKDGHLAVAALEPKFWNRLVTCLGLGDLENQGWVEGEDAQAVRARLTAVLRKRTSAEWEDFFRPLDLCVDPVRRSEDSEKTDPQIDFLMNAARADAAGQGGEMGFSPIFGWLKTQGNAPQLGADNERVFGRVDQTEESI